MHCFIQGISSVMCHKYTETVQKKYNRKLDLVDLFHAGNKHGEGDNKMNRNERKTNKKNNKNINFYFVAIQGTWTQTASLYQEQIKFGLSMFTNENDYKH